jgi:phosphate transport system substrate-binding protein
MSKNMSNRKKLVLALALLSLSAPAFAAKQVVINGSTTVLPVVQKAGEAFMAAHPDVELSISGGGSGNGLKALIEKQCDIAMSSRDIKGKEVDAAKKNGVNPQRTAIAVDAIVPVVNPANPVSGLTVDQLRDIYTARSPTGRTWAARTPKSWSSRATPLPAPLSAGKNDHEEAAR